MYIYGRGKEAENIGERRMEERARRERGTERERERGREEPRRNEGPNVAKPPISVTIYPYRRLVQEMIITSPSPPLLHHFFHVHYPPVSFPSFPRQLLVLFERFDFCGSRDLRSSRSSRSLELSGKGVFTVVTLGSLLTHK